MKTCSVCGDLKELSDFNKQKAGRDGYQPRCRLCEKIYRQVNKEHIVERSKKYCENNKDSRIEYRKKYREGNPGKSAELSKKWREDNPEKMAKLAKKWYEANKERRAAYNKKWCKTNPEKKRSIRAKRRSVKLQAHPPWAATLEKRQIEAFYTLAKIQSEATGKEYHGDHIHPLQSPKVVMFEGEMIPLICGLHVPANLQILEASVNCSKSNKFEPYIESECDFTEPWQVRSNDRTPIPTLIQTPIDRIPRRNPSALIKPRKSKGVSKGQLSLF